MNRTFDVIVAGLGAMGSAAVFHLARRGVRVLGIDQFDPPHTLGSSHGETRVIREAYFEDPVYVPLVQRAYDLWAQLEQDSGEPLYLRTGGVMLGARDSTVATGAQRSAREHRLPHQVLDSAEVRRRFPALNPSDDMIGILEPRAGILFPEACVKAHLSLARKHRAELLLNTRIIAIESTDGDVTLRTTAGNFTSPRAVVTAGPWLSELLPGLGMKLETERQTLHWFRPCHPELFALDHCPIHLWEYEPGKMFYGFPDLGTGVKVALHHQGITARPEEINRQITDEDISRMRNVVRRFVPSADGEYLRGSVCIYTNTADEHFLLDRHPAHENVIIGSACSGHGFKFASAIGELLANLATSQPNAIDVSRFCFRTSPGVV